MKKLTLGACGQAVVKGSVLELEGELLGFETGETSLDHLRVGEEDTVHAKTSSLNGKFVHFLLMFSFINYIYYKSQNNKEK